MTRQSAPLRTACAPTAASPRGLLPYTYCQAHTCSPAAFRADTFWGVNWLDQKLVPSELLRNTVLTPLARARDSIALRLPPSLLWRIQIHIPCPSSAVPLAGAETGRRTTRRIRTTRDQFERRVPLRTRTRPPVASAGSQNPHRRRQRRTGATLRPHPRAAPYPSTRPAPPRAAP